MAEGTGKGFVLKSKEKQASIEKEVTTKAHISLICGINDWRPGIICYLIYRIEDQNISALSTTK